MCVEEEKVDKINDDDIRMIEKTASFEEQEEKIMEHERNYYNQVWKESHTIL